MGPHKPYLSEIRGLPRSRLGSLIKHRPETKALSLGKQEQLTLSFLLPPSQHPVCVQLLSVALRAELLETTAWKTLFILLSTLHTLPRGKSKQPSERQRRELVMLPQSRPATTFSVQRWPLMTRSQGHNPVCLGL